jgi:exopolysaccharide biosynthesis protein
VGIGYHLASDSPVPFAFAVGGFPVLRGGAPLAGLDDVTSAVRTAAGVSADGHHLYLVGLEGQAESGAGLTVSEVAALLAQVGAADAVNLDGGGSTTLAVREPGQRTVTVQNHPSGGAERPVANGIGVFSR